MIRASDAVRRTLPAALLAAALATPCAAQTAGPASIPWAPSRGDIVPAFESLGIDGKPRKVDFPKGSETVLLFFLSGCPHCHRMIPEWNRAYEQRPKGLNVVGVLMDQEPPGFWSTIAISFPVVRAPGREFLRSLNVNRAPLTLRVGPGGRIEDVALGEACTGGAGTPGVTCVDAIHFGELFAPPR
jgi:thiol-disulfide isomerase/thioredoxin